MSVRFAEINEENYYDVLKIKPTKEQEEARFVAPVVNSLADAWLYRNDGSTLPYAIYRNDELVGFILVDKNIDDKQYFIWRLTIDEKFQGQGIGKQVMEVAIAEAKKIEGLEKVVADYVVGNEAMKQILIKKGFVETNYIEKYHEYEMSFFLSGQ